MRLVELAAQGMTDKAIAAATGLSVHTVDTHWKKLRARFETSSRTEVVAAALREKFEEERAELLRRIAILEANPAAANDHAAESQLAADAVRELAQVKSEAERAESIEVALTTAEVVVYAIESDLPYRCRFVSHSLRHWGFDPTEFLAGKPSPTDLVYPPDLAVIHPCIQSLIDAGHRRLELTYRRVDRHGAPRWVIDRSVLRDDGGGTRVILGAALDVQNLVDDGRLPGMTTRVDAFHAAWSPGTRDGMGRLL